MSAEQRCPMADEKMLEKYSSLYLEIVMRYRDYIEERETLHAAELPTLVTPRDPAVVAKAEGIKRMFNSYNYDLDFPEAAKEAEFYVRSKISEANLPLQFWLRPSQAIELEVGDVFDKAVLLCSLLIGLGNASSRIIARVKDGETRRLAVSYEFNNRVFVFEMSEGSLKEFPTRAEMLGSLGINEEGVDAYEFNDLMYDSLT
jgi:hypothetical protein